MKKIVPKTMNFGSPNLTKQKKNLETQQSVTQKRILGTQQNITIFLQYFLFPAIVGLSLILLFYFLYLQHFHNKFLVKYYYWF